MKLYYSKGACSFAPHTVLEELGVPYEAVSVNLAEPPSPEYLKINPMGAVPVLALDNGETLTEVAAILQYLASLKPELNLAPKPGTMEHFRLLEWLNFIATELHKGFGPLWALEYMTQSKSAQDEIRAFAIHSLGERLDVIATRLGSRDYLLPSGFSVADVYLYTILSWAFFMKLDLSRWPTVTAHWKRIRERPATMRALKAEHLA